MRKHYTSSLFNDLILNNKGLMQTFTNWEKKFRMNFVSGAYIKQFELNSRDPQACVKVWRRLIKQIFIYFIYRACVGLRGWMTIYI